MRNYCQILVEAESSATLAIVRNDFASIAATERDDANARKSAPTTFGLIHE
jgi:hypothetical protein